MAEERVARRSLNDSRQGRTDWDAVERQSDADIAANVAADPDAAPLLDRDWCRRVTRGGPAGDRHDCPPTPPLI